MFNGVTRVFALADATTVEGLLDRLQVWTCRGSLSAVLLHSWEDGWLLRVSLQRQASRRSLVACEAMIGEYGRAVDLPESAATALLLLDAGESPLAVMRRTRIPIIVCDGLRHEELRSFCEGLQRGLGYRPPSLR